MEILFPYFEKEEIDREKLGKLFNSGNSGIEFRELYGNIEFNSKWLPMNQAIAANNPDSNTDSTNRNANSEKINVEQDSLLKIYPISRYFYPNMDQRSYLLPGCVLGYISDKDTSAFNKLVSVPEIQRAIMRNSRFAYDFVRSKTKSELKNTVRLYCLKNTDQKPLLTSADITDAKTSTDNNGNPCIQFSFDERGTKIWADLTERVAIECENDPQKSGCIGMLMNGYVLSAPKVMGKIQSSECQISGEFTKEECATFASIIKNSFPYKSRIVNLEIISDK